MVSAVLLCAECPHPKRQSGLAKSLAAPILQPSELVSFFGLRLMLLRAAIIYCLAVSTILFGGIALWQRIEIAAGRATVADLMEQAQRLQLDFDKAAIEASSAKRVAEAAQDSLQRELASRPAEPDQSGLAEQLATLSHERDAARAQASGLAEKADALGREAERAKAALSALQKALEEAKRASADADAARLAAELELSGFKAKAISALPGNAREPESAGEAPITEAEVVPPAAAPSPSAPVAAEPSATTDKGATQAPAGELQPAAVPVPVVPAPPGHAAGKGSAAPRSQANAPPSPVKKAAKKRPSKAQSESGIGTFFPF